MWVTIVLNNQTCAQGPLNPSPVYSYYVYILIKILIIILLYRQTWRPSCEPIQYIIHPYIIYIWFILSNSVVCYLAEIAVRAGLGDGVYEGIQIHGAICIQIIHAWALYDIHIDMGTPIPGRQGAKVIVPGIKRRYVYGAPSWGDGVWWEVVEDCDLLWPGMGNLAGFRSISSQRFPAHSQRCYETHL